MDARSWAGRLLRINLVQLGLNSVLAALLALWFFYPGASGSLEPTATAAWSAPTTSSSSPGSGGEPGGSAAPPPSSAPSVPTVVVGPQPGEGVPSTTLTDPDVAANSPLANYLRDVVFELDSAAKAKGVDVRGYLPSREERVAAESTGKIDHPHVQALLARLARGFAMVGKELPAYGSTAGVTETEATPKPPSE